MTLRSFAKSSLLATVRALTGRHPVLLPPEAENESAILRVRCPYRVEGTMLGVELLESDSQAGELFIELLGYEGHFPRRSLWSAKVTYDGPCRLELDLSTGEVTLGGKSLGSAPAPIETRRFCWNLRLDTSSSTKRRLTGHYRAAMNGSYYGGDNYVDYEAEAKGDVPTVRELVRRHDVRGPLLEVGCATGVVLGALVAEGLEAYGVDYSEWAVEQARKRLGDVVFLGDVEKGELPPTLAARAPFECLLLWTVLEHFREPYRVVRRLSRHAASGARLVLRTTNAASLNHHLFGAQWEGYFDSSHHGVELVSVESLRRELAALGWRIVELETHLCWDSNADSLHAALRDWWASDARFRRLLAELERGDLITCVAVKS